MRYTLNIGLKIKQLRQEKGLSQEELANKIHCSSKTISNLENDKYLSDLYQIINICDVLGTDLDRVFSVNSQESELFQGSCEQYPFFTIQLPKNRTYSQSHRHSLDFILKRLPHLTEHRACPLKTLISLW